MISLTLAAAVAAGIHLLYGAIVDPSPTRGEARAGAARRRATTVARRWLLDVGLEDLEPREFGSAVVLLSVIGGAAGYALFGGPLPALVLAGFTGSFPVGAYRSRRRHRRRQAHAAWPRLIDELRIQTTSMGRSIPHALFHVGARSPVELRTSFDAARREWLLTTDFPRTLGTLKERLGDPSADAVAETLLIAHELGGSDLDRRLEDLANDRRHDVQDRKDAHARLAGARFARIFVLAVPAGMALAGMSIGDGRAAYRTGTGQIVVVVALGLVISCWVWAGRLMRLPEPQRVFAE